jgi:choline dehydrogenase-like flavoprotein
VDEQFDYVVIGGGSAGAIVARRIADDPGVTVCLVEAGPSDEGDQRVARIGHWTQLVGSELVRDFPIEHQTRGNSALLHTRAYVLGGCGSHNQGIAFRAPATDMAGWERLGATGWGPDGTDRHFDAVLERVGVEAAPPRNACAAAFVEAARQAGLPLTDFTDPDVRDGVGWLRLSIRGPLRRSASIAYLHPIDWLPENLTLLTETTARRLVIGEGRVVGGIETTAGVLSARREVIVCCGAIESPKLLLLSGIGPADHLRRLGIPAVYDSPGVGLHLVDHPEGTLIWEACRPVPTGVVQNWEAGLLARTEPSLDRPDVMMHFGTMAVEPGWVPPGYPTPWDAFWMTPNVTRPRSEGIVRLRSADPEEPPVVDPRYFTDEAGYDEATMLAGMRLARRIAGQPALAHWTAREIVPGPNVESDQELSEFARRHGSSVQHPAGTCRMGPAKDPLAVVDPSLRVRGVERLRLADASVFPAMIGVNINITCMMVGEKCADLVTGG